MRVLRLKFLNPFTIALIAALPVEILTLYGGAMHAQALDLFEPGYQFAVAMRTLGIAAQATGTIMIFSIATRTRFYTLIPFQELELSTTTLKILKYIFFAAALFSFYKLATAEFGLLNWIINPRTGYQLYRSAQGHWYAATISFLSISFVASFFSAPRAGNILMNLPMYFGFAYLLGSKGIMFAYFVSAATFLWFVRFERLVLFTFVTGTTVVAMQIYNLRLALDRDIDFLAVLEFFDYMWNASLYYRDYLSSSVSLMYGDMLASSFWSYVPRWLYPEKPEVYGIMKVIDLFYPGAVDRGNYPAFGGGVAQFADFGVLGVLLLNLLSPDALLTGVIASYIFVHPRIDFQQATLASVLLVLIQYGPAFGLFIPGALYFIFVALVAVALSTLSFSFRRRRSAEGSFHVPT